MNGSLAELRFLIGLSNGANTRRARSAESGSEPAQVHMVIAAYGTQELGEKGVPELGDLITGNTSLDAEYTEWPAWLKSKLFPITGRRRHRARHPRVAWVRLAAEENPAIVDKASWK